MYVKWMPGGRDPFHFETRTISDRDWMGATGIEHDTIVWDAAHGHMVPESKFSDEVWPIIVADPDMVRVNRFGQPAGEGDDVDYGAMKVDELRDELDKRRLDNTGKKADLVERLEANDVARVATTEDAGDAASGTPAPPGVMDGTSGANVGSGGSAGTSGVSTAGAGSPGGSTTTTG